MTLDVTTDDGTVDVTHDSQLLARYDADAEGSKPGFNVIALPEGVGRSGGTNLVLAAPHDHPWHLGAFFCQKLVDGINCWESELGDSGDGAYGYAEHENYSVDQLDGAVSITQTATWESTREELLLEDERTIRILEPTDTGYPIVWEQSVTALGQTRHLSSETLHGHYSGLSVRFARSLTDGRVLLPDETDVGETSPPRAASGPQGRWCDYSGPLDGRRHLDEWTAGITMFDHPDNDCHPVNWFVMTEPFGFLAANPTWEAVLTLPTGETQSWTWGMWIHPGTPNEQRVEETYQQFLSHTD